MTAADLHTARKKAGLSQSEAAKLLAVSQAYLSMLERGDRAISAAIAQRAAEHLPVPPVSLPFTGTRPEHFEDALGVLGYPGFAYIREGRRYNPAELLLLALDTETLPARAVEGLPWLPLAFPDLDWDWLLREAKLRNCQNRLGYVLELSRQAAQRLGSSQVEEHLKQQLQRVEQCRLATEDTLCRAQMTKAERQWQQHNRPALAVHWNLLTHMKLEHLSHVGI